MQINKTKLIFWGIIMGILLFFGFSYLDVEAQRRTRIYDRAPVGAVVIGPFICSTIPGDEELWVGGWAYDPAYSYLDKDERVQIRVCYEGRYCDTYNTGYTSKYWPDAACGSLGGWCGFQVDLNPSYLKEGSNLIQVYAIDPDNNSQTLIDQGSVTAIKRSCSGPAMTIAPYTFNRADLANTWAACPDYAIGHSGNSPYAPRCFFNVAWPSIWKTGSWVVDAKNLGLMPHVQGGGNAYTLRVTVHTPLTNIYGYNYSAQQECAILCQDYPADSNILTDEYYCPGPDICAALGTSKTSITQGESVRLAWQTSNVSSADLSNVGSVALNGTRLVSPAQTTTYTLTGDWYGFKVTSSVTITVQPFCTPSCDTCSVSCGGGTQTCTRADCSTYSQSCNTQCCPVNGGWSAWSGWSGWSACISCSQSRTRTRTCTNPAPSCGGADCSGSSTETETQSCGLVNGGWSAWSNTGSCGTYQTCKQRQDRTCTNPTPSCGGASCSGVSTQYLDCGAVNGGWSAWSACSVSCGGGTQTRTCTNPSPSCGGTDCTGSSSQSCNTQVCPPEAPTNLTAIVINCTSVRFSWSAVSGVTGYYVDIAKSQSDLNNQTGTFQNRDAGNNTSYTWNGLSESTTYYWRVWAYNASGGVHGYPTPPTVSTPCCPVTGGWSAWSSWSACSVSCGGGTQSRTRTCTNPAPACGGATCSGSSSETQSCNTQPCNNPPSTTNLNATQPDYCLVGWASAIFSWTYSDPDNDTQSAYQLQADNNSSFSSPEVDSGKVISSSNSFATQAGQLSFNNTYYWRLKVWDSKDLSCSWLFGPSFTTPRHAYPSINFSWTPQNPTVNENTQFVDQSTVYGGAAKSAWSWTFQNGSPPTSTLQNPLIKFLSTGAKSVTLKATDSDGFNCTGQKTVNTLLTLPEWQEIAPF